LSHFLARNHRHHRAEGADTATRFSSTLSLGCGSPARGEQAGDCRAAAVEGALEDGVAFEIAGFALFFRQHGS